MLNIASDSRSVNNILYGVCLCVMNSYISKSATKQNFVHNIVSDADRRLCSVYGDTIHQNDGAHLDGGIGVAEDAKWQRLHLRVAACNLQLYDLPNGC